VRDIGSGLPDPANFLDEEFEAGGAAANRIRVGVLFAPV
jgi:hypothetical protein